MDASSIYSGSKSGASIFTVAAWGCLVIPFVAPALGFVILVTSGGRLDIPLIAGLCLAASSFILGAISLFGIQRHGARRILWKALVGMIASLVLGFCAFVYLESLKYWHG
jgi:hypothetical protein